MILKEKAFYKTGRIESMSNIFSSGANFLLRFEAACFDLFFPSVLIFIILQLHQVY